MRSCLANGSGASGFHKTVTENYTRCHAKKAMMWRGHVQNMSVRQAPFYDLNDPRAETELPSLAYLLEVTVLAMETRHPYYIRKMQMILGRFLSGDHSHKVAKVVLIQGNRVFHGVYTLMNEFGQILGFWFTSGTNLEEVEEALRGVARRYKQHGHDGPEAFTTDRCCQEREFFAGTSNKMKKPIFASLGGDAVEVPVEDAEAASPETVDVQYLDLSEPPVVLTQLALANTAAASIIRDYQQKNWSAIAIDSEWSTRSREQNAGPDTAGPDMLQVGLPNGKVYIFLLRRYRQFPNNLKVLLEHPSISKVACMISSDKAKLREVGVHLHSTLR